MKRGHFALLAAGLFGGALMLAGPASAVPAGPAGVQTADAPIVQVRMTRSERMMMKKRMMRKRMMRRDRMMRNGRMMRRERMMRNGRM